MTRILLKERSAFGNADTGGAWLSSARANERNPLWNPEQTAGDKPEESENDVKSSCPLCSGRHTCYNGRDKGSRAREGELTPKTRPQFGLQAATRLHEAGIASNRRRNKVAVLEGAAGSPPFQGELMLVGYFGFTLLYTQRETSYRVKLGDGSLFSFLDCEGTLAWRTSPARAWFETKPLLTRIDGAIQVRSNADPTFYSLVGPGRESIHPLPVYGQLSLDHRLDSSLMESLPENSYIPYQCMNSYLSVID
ncbi:hypothetical protein SAY87_012217 [Trapa incisa]|uniref:Uncharacterized protein ycf68 n=1 Tax=Trapa incisa TaxID=236973 RepID=A0AAN7GNE6_9MYRT|nr:hypothetical protein SAY87_012217 [Trapa incisa]